MKLPDLPSMFSNKKGQFYIFAAILLVTYALTINPPTVEIKKATPVFKQLYQNYLFEAPKVMNSAVYDNANITERFMNFSDTFSSYAKSREAKFGMVYLLAHQDGVDIKNYLSETANISTNTTSFLLGPGNWKTMNRAGSLAVYLNSIRYDFSFTESMQLKAIFKSSADNEVKVYVQR